MDKSIEKLSILLIIREFPQKNGFCEPKPNRIEFWNNINSLKNTYIEKFTNLKTKVFILLKIWMKYQISNIKKEKMKLITTKILIYLKRNATWFWNVEWKILYKIIKNFIYYIKNDNKEYLDDEYILKKLDLFPYRHSHYIKIIINTIINFYMG